MVVYFASSLSPNALNTHIHFFLFSLTKSLYLSLSPFVSLSSLFLNIYISLFLTHSLRLCHSLSLSLSPLFLSFSLPLSLCFCPCISLPLSLCFCPCNFLCLSLLILRVFRFFSPFPFLVEAIGRERRRDYESVDDIGRLR